MLERDGAKPRLELGARERTITVPTTCHM